ncbi:MAG: glycosyltransferase family 1 protein [Chitinophagaceae bacterium]
MTIENLDLVCFSHLRWNFVFQRPQHLLIRFAKNRRVFYIEDPVYGEVEDFCQVTQSEIHPNIYVVVPNLKVGTPGPAFFLREKELLTEVFKDNGINNYIFWYYNPMAMLISDHFTPSLVVYDCMDELSAFKSAPLGLKENEDELFKKADLVFTGGYSLYEAKKHRHPAVYAFPSSIDKEHFKKARLVTNDPEDQKSIPYPRIGFYGVIDERMNINLVKKVAELRPEWQMIFIGPVVKIDPATLPKLSNIHYLGNKSYQELPSYLAGWNISMIPFALNESTQFISPTKTPEYLAAGKSVISSSIQDVVNPYGNNKLVYIADTPEDFIAAAESDLSMLDRKPWLDQVDNFLKDYSWDQTWKQMNSLISDKFIDKVQEKNITNLNLKEKIYV